VPLPKPVPGLVLHYSYLWRHQHAAAHGAPPVPSSVPGSPDQFEVIPSDIRTFPGPGGTMLRITPVNRLRVVMVQTGYRRLDPQNNPVDCKYVDNSGRPWYPGMELFGEGIFIDLAPGRGEAIPRHPALQGQEAATWLDAWADPPSYQLDPTDEDRHMLHPVFVWWHSLAHRLNNALGIDSGYSSASIRERLRNIAVCSNDPLCGEERFGPARQNGAACYACSLISETSCEYRNTHLDRNLLLRNLP
jgi:hypothetical protein